jgi:transcriptional regulator with XRE-family HTH domain
MKDPDFRRGYDALEEEFALILEVAKARRCARLGWSEVTRRMKATRRTIAKLENGRVPSTRALSRFAKATGHRLKISFEPVPRLNVRTRRRTKIAQSTTAF